MDKPNLLLVDDHEHILKQLSWALSEDFSVQTAVSKGEAIEAIGRVRPALMTIDLTLSPSGDNRQEGLDVLQAALRADPTIKAIVVTSDQEEATAVRAVRMGAFDYFVKPLPVAELHAALKRAAYLRSLDQGPAVPAQMAEISGVVGESLAINELRHLVHRVAETEFTALILGESGVGKELVADAIWKLGARQSRPLIVVNCAAIPESLLETELFGHERGAFTGAHAQKKGKFELAHGGTLFLDEIGELSHPLQAKLLRFLQSQMLERVGGTKPIQVDVRVIAATNRDLEEAVRQGSFREDLYYRLRVLPIRVPPLRERDDDILLLANYFLDRVAAELGTPRKRLAHDAELVLKQHSWPGNVRELENVIKAAAVTSDRNLIFARHVNLSVSSDTFPCDLRATRDELERALVERALKRNNGVISRAARDLAISRVTLYDLLDKHNLRGPTRARE